MGVDLLRLLLWTGGLKWEDLHAFFAAWRQGTNDQYLFEEMPGMWPRGWERDSGYELYTNLVTCRQSLGECIIL